MVSQCDVSLSESILVNFIINVIIIYADTYIVSCFFCPVLLVPSVVYRCLLHISYGMKLKYSALVFCHHQTRDSVLCMYLSLYFIF